MYVLPKEKEAHAMKANYNLTGTKRKELVQAIAEITGEKADYKRMPTCAYEIGNITVDKDGGVSCSDEEKMQKVMEALNEKGFTAEEDARPSNPSRRRPQSRNTHRRGREGNFQPRMSRNRR
jgi:predicted ArsR family transcriptional regulator